MKKITTILLITLLISGCSTYYYYPTFHDISTNTKERELKAQYFSSGDNQGVDLSYTLSKNFGTFMCFNTFDDYKFKDGAQILDLGVYFYSSKNQLYGRDISYTFSISGAYGVGQNYRYHSYYDININRAFIQPSVAISSKFIDFGLSSGLSYVDFNLRKKPVGDVDYIYSDLYDIGEKGFFFFEPQVFLGVGYKGIKLNYHLMELNKINSPGILYYDEPVGYLSLSLKFDVQKIFNK